MSREWIIGPVLVVFNIVSVLLLLPFIALIHYYEQLGEKND